MDGDDPRRPWPAHPDPPPGALMPPPLSTLPPPLFPAPFGRSPSASGTLSPFVDEDEEEHNLPNTPRSPSPTLSPPSSPKRQRAEQARADLQAAADSAAEDDLEMRAAALGLNESTQRVWRETALPPTPSSPSPTFSPPSSPKQRRQAELRAEAAAAKLAASLSASVVAFSDALSQGGRSCDSDSDASMAGMALDPDTVTAAIAAWEAGQGQERGEGSASGSTSGGSRKRR